MQAVTSYRVQYRDGSPPHSHGALVPLGYVISSKTNGDFEMQPKILNNVAPNEIVDVVDKLLAAGVSNINIDTIVLVETDE